MVCRSDREPRKNGLTHRDAVWDAEPRITLGHIGATWRIRLNGPCAAAIDIGRKEGAAVLLSRELGPRLVQCCLGRGLLPYQAASSSIQPFGHNRHGPKFGRVGVPFFLGVAGSTSNTMSRRPRTTSVPSCILTMQPFGDNRRGPKIGWGSAPFGVGGWVPI